MMLWHGALSDALGRRPIIIGGLAIYAFATLGCAIAGNIETLWLFRAAQGISAGTGMVVGRAIIRDRFQGAEAQRLMAQVTLVFSIAPAIAPDCRRRAAQHAGMAIDLLGAAAVGADRAGVVNALPAGNVAPVTSPRAAPACALAQLRERPRRARVHDAFTLIPTLNFAAFFIYIAVAPTFLVELLGVSTWGFAWLFVPMITGHHRRAPRCPGAWRDEYPRSGPFASATRSSPWAPSPTS